MANVSPNMKVNVAADTSQFDRGMKAAKAEVRDFGKVSDSVLGKLGEVVGIDTRQVEQMSNAIRGMGRQMTDSGTEGAAAFGKLLSSVGKLQVGLAALGIAGVVTAFKALNVEAENFKSTVAGANIEMQTAAYIDTYRQVLHDFNAATGKSVAEFQSDWQKTFARFKANFQQNVVNLVSKQNSFWSFDKISGVQAAFPLVGTLFGGNRQEQRVAQAAASAAEDIAGRIYQLERQRKEQAVELSKLSAQITDQLGIAKDHSVTLADRQAAVAEAERLIAEKRAMTVPLEQELASLYAQMSAQASDSVQAADELLAQQQRQYDVERAITQEENGLLKLKNSLTTETGKQNAELQKQLELQRQIAQSRADLAALDLSVNGFQAPGAVQETPVGIVPRVEPEQVERALYAQLGDSLYLRIGFEPDTKSFIDFTNQVENLFADLASSIGESLGGLIGDLATGGDAFGNFRNAALSAFGDMATTVGKMAIATGVATLGIQAALETLNGWAAIAAGTALVALGAAVKAGLSNVASGNYSASTNVASGSYSSGYNNNYETRDVQVQVTGKLQADGDQLVAVLNNTANKKDYTT